MQPYWSARLRSLLDDYQTAFSTDRVRLPHATLLPLVPTPGVGPPPARRPPWRAPHQGVPEVPRATGRHPAPQGTDRTGGRGRAAGAAGAAGEDRFKRGESLKRLIQKLFQRWRRWGDADAGRPCLPTHAPCAGRRQAEQETAAAWSCPMAAVGDGSVTHEARSGRGPGAGFLADTGWGNGRGVCRKLQMLEDLPHHLAVRDGGDDPQRPPLTARAARQLQRQHALQPSGPAPAAGPRCPSPHPPRPVGVAWG